MSAPVGPRLPEWMTHPLDAIKSSSKNLWSIVQKSLPKPTAPSEKPHTGYSLVHVAKQKDREQVFTTLADASNKAEDIFKEVIPQKDDEFYSTLYKLHDLLISRTPQTGFQAANKEALKLIRTAVTSESYLAACHDESNPAIKYIHRLVLASFIDNKPLDTFQEVGSSLMPKEGFSSDRFAKQVLEARDKGQAEHKLIKNDSTIGYVARFTKCALSALKAEKLIPGLQNYDPRMDEENYPGSISEEEISRDGRKIKLRAVFSASPTIGDCVAPEARALLQALKNRRLMRDEELQKDPYPYTHWTYTSFQNLEAHNEGARAKAIMDLQKEFPGTFTGVTVSLDSEFFLDGLSGKDEEEMRRQKIEHGAEELTDEYAVEMYKEILSNPKYFFPQPPELWAKDLIEIIENAKNVVLGTEPRKVTSSRSGKEARIEQAARKNFPKISTEGEKRPHIFKKIASVLFDRVARPSPPLSADKQEKTENWEKKAAFRELVVLGLIRYWQLQSAPSKGIGLTTCACKESVDRGAQVNSALLWALGDGSSKSLASAFNLVQGKALVDRNRLVLLARLAPAHALWKHVPQEAAHTFLMGIPQQIRSSFSLL